MPDAAVAAQPPRVLLVSPCKHLRVAGKQLLGSYVHSNLPKHALRA